MGQNLVQPLERAVQVYLDPAGGARDVLTVVLCTPALGGTKIRGEKGSDTSGVSNHVPWRAESMQVFISTNHYTS